MGRGPEGSSFDDPGDPAKRRAVEVGPMEAIRIPRGQFQRGWNRPSSDRVGDVRCDDGEHGDGEDGDGDDAEGERVKALAVGAPLAYGEQLKRDDCPACDGEVLVDIERAPDDDGAVVTVCADCGAEVARWARGADGENGRV